MIVLAIESTCDETGCAVARSVQLEAVATMAGRGVEILADVKASSAEILSKYGGIVPEIAAREQVAAIIPVIEEAIRESGVRKAEIDAVAVTQGPGLIGSLLIGIETAKILALTWKKPLIPVNHMAAHVFANWIAPTAARSGGQVLDHRVLELPAIALIVSGGHTDIMLLTSFTDWKWLGGTRDDAAGEAFDKAARAMGFPYPGGPEIAKAATMAVGKTPDDLVLPRPMFYEDNLEMSFSGLKTALVEMMERNRDRFGKEHNLLHLLAREFNQAVVDVLVKKVMMAVGQYQPKSVVLAGGVAANTNLREALAKAVKEAGKDFFMPDLKYCTDNAAMVAACALMRPDYIDPLKMRPEPGLEIN